jgi:hypothetical protein
MFFISLSGWQGWKQHTGFYQSAEIVDTPSTSEINERWKQGYNHPLCCGVLFYPFVFM